MDKLIQQSLTEANRHFMEEVRLLGKMHALKPDDGAPRAHPGFVDEFSDIARLQSLVDSLTQQTQQKMRVMHATIGRLDKAVQQLQDQQLESSVNIVVASLESANRRLRERVEALESAPKQH